MSDTIYEFPDFIGDFLQWLDVDVSKILESR